MIFIAIGLTLVATVYDLRRREVPDWIGAALVVCAVAAIGGVGTVVAQTPVVRAVGRAMIAIEAAMIVSTSIQIAAIESVPAVIRSVVVDERIIAIIALPALQDEVEPPIFQAVVNLVRLTCLLAHC